MYKSLIRLAATYRAGSWMLKSGVTKWLSVVERKVLRRVSDELK
jgi:hypothetical protein